MTVTISGKEYNIYVGIDFLSYLDKIYSVNREGVEIGSGLSMAVIYIADENPVVLFHLIRAGTITEKSKPSNDDIKKYLETEADYEELFTNFLDKFENTPITAKKMKQFAEATKEAEKENDKDSTGA